MSGDSIDLRARGFSLARPYAGAVVRGPCRVLNLGDVPTMAAGGELVAIHAQAKWSQDEEAVVRELWPECPARGDVEHPTGLVGVGLVQRVEWCPANADVASDPWAMGPWCIVLQDVVAFSRPYPCDGYAGLFPLGERLSDVIARAWTERPL